MQTIEFRGEIKNGIIQIPRQLKGKVAQDVQVILILPKVRKKTTTDMIDELMAQPLKATGFKPMLRDEAHARE